MPHKPKPRTPPNFHQHWAPPAPAARGEKDQWVSMGERSPQAPSDEGIADLSQSAAAGLRPLERELANINLLNSPSNKPKLLCTAAFEPGALNP
mmetsp:Transcript_845/g.1635  ORF Transcript_845/g.1635 Transcript_845/m.1635 type:complete len:94 (+) Transcript_845:504-785(+)